MVIWIIFITQNDALYTFEDKINGGDMSSPYFIRSMLSYIKNLRLYLKIRCELRNIIHSRILERYPYYLPSKNYFPRTQSTLWKKKKKKRKTYRIILIARKQLFIEEKIPSLRRSGLGWENGDDKPSRSESFSSPFLASKIARNRTRYRRINIQTRPLIPRGDEAEIFEPVSFSSSSRFAYLLPPSLFFSSPPSTSSHSTLSTRFIPADRPFRPFSASRAVESFAFSTITLRSTRIIL